MFTYQVEPRFSETDALGHINNTIVPNWFEHGRMPIFQLFNPDLSLAKWNLILKKMDVDFVAQIYLFFPVEIRSWITAIGNTSFGVHQEVWQKGELVAQGDCVMVHFDYENQSKAPIPNEVRERLNEHLLPKPA